MRTTVAATRPSDFGPLHGLASAGRRDSNACVHYTLYVYIIMYSKCNTRIIVSAMGAKCIVMIFYRNTSTRAN